MQGALTRNFLEIWVFSASMDVISQCLSMCSSAHLNPAAIPELLSTLAELLELACRQVEKLGMLNHYLPRAHPFLMSADIAAADGSDEESPTSMNISRMDLKQGLESEEAFVALYRGLLEKALDAWNGSMRTRNATKIKATLAALEQSAFALVRTRMPKNLSFARLTQIARPPICFRGDIFESIGVVFPTSLDVH